MIKMLTIDEVADILRISKSTAYNLMHSIGFARFKIARSWHVDEQLLLKWFREKSVA
jgi:excisionase family DNA binding protein